jgi:hypothetical protein
MTVNLGTGDIVSLGYSSSSSSGGAGGSSSGSGGSKPRTVDMQGAFLMPVSVLDVYNMCVMANMRYNASGGCQ